MLYMLVRHSMHFFLHKLQIMQVLLSYMQTCVGAQLDMASRFWTMTAVLMCVDMIDKKTECRLHFTDSIDKEKRTVCC